jgi:hypothetical protein
MERKKGEDTVRKDREETGDGGALGAGRAQF